MNTIPLAPYIQERILSGPLTQEDVASKPVNNEEDTPLCSLDSNNCKIVSTGDSRFGGSKIESPVPITRMRQPLYDGLLLAVENLPDKCGIAVYEGHRPLSVQRQYFDEKVNELKEKNPNLTDAEAKTEASIFVSNPDGQLVPPHSTGGAIDILLFNYRNGEPDDTFTFLDTGKFGAIFGPNPHPETLSTKDLSKIQLSNRHTMLKAMLDAGFYNYGKEFWHYAMGDQMSAYLSGEPSAKFGAI